MILQVLHTHFLLSFRNIIRQKRRSFIAIGAVACGIIALILSGGFIEWIFMDFRETTIKSQLGHIQIVRPGYHDTGKSDPFSFLLPDTLPELTHQADQVNVITPRITFSALVSHGESTLSFIGEGVDPKEQEAFGNALQISSGKNLSSLEPSHIIMGEGLARNLGVDVGDQIVLLANTASGGINAVEVTIRGLFNTVTKSYDDNALRIPIETAQKLLRTQGAHSWVVLLHDTNQTDTVLNNLRNQLPSDEFEIVAWYTLADFYNKTVTLFTKQVQGIKIIIALIILLSITNTMTMNVMERISEIGTAMALGVKRTGIIYMFLSEGVLIGLIGGVLGLVIGLFLAHIISNIGIPMPPPPGMARGYIGEILVTGNMALESLLLAVITTLTASVYPAWRASRMQIVDALRHSR